MVDISITGRGPYEAESLTEEGAAWLWSNVAEAESAGNGVVVACIASGDEVLEIAQEAAAEEGLEVEINGTPYNDDY